MNNLEAKKCGALCDSCPLNGQPYVGPTARAKPLLHIVGEFPSQADVEADRLFQGQAGWVLHQGLKANAINAATVALNAAILCKPKLRMHKDEWKKAVACCKPRLHAQLAGDAPILGLGSLAQQTLTGKASVVNWQGYKQGRVLTCVSAWHVAQKPAYIPLLKRLIRRALQDTDWQWGRMSTPQRPSELYDLLTEIARSPYVAVDIENLGDPLTSDIRTIGVGTTEVSASVHTTPPAAAAAMAVLRFILASPKITKVLHNAQHDILALRSIGMAVNGPIFDTMLAHAVVYPQLPHDLGFAVMQEFPAPRWKSEFKVAGDDKGKGLQRFVNASMEELCAYNNRDVQATAHLYKALSAKLDKIHRGWELFNGPHGYQTLDLITLKMRTRGIRVNTANQSAHRGSLTALLEKFRTEFGTLAGEEYTLGKAGQHPSLAKLFFKKLNVPPVSYSETTGKASLDSNALTTYLGSPIPIVKKLSFLIMQYRKHAKLLTAYVDNLEVYPDGFAHPTWRVFGARTGRWSSTAPAMQTIPKPNKMAGTPGMRDIFQAAPGNVLVEADYSQLELRVVAFLAKDDKLLDWYAQGLDVHTMNAKDIFGKDPTPQQRDMAKRVVYGLNYGGGADTIWKSLVTTYPELQLKAVELVMKGWFKAHPKIKAWQDAQLELAKRNLYVEEALSGRRQYYYDGHVKPSEVLNYPIQGAAGTIANMALASLAATLDWSDEFLLMQVHDSIIIEGPKERTKELVNKLKTAMEQPITLDGATVHFPVDVKVGENWGYLEKWHE